MKFWAIQSNGDLMTVLIRSLMTVFLQWRLILERISIRCSRQSLSRILGTDSLCLYAASLSFVWLDLNWLRKPLLTYYTSSFIFIYFFSNMKGVLNGIFLIFNVTYMNLFLTDAPHRCAAVFKRKQCCYDRCFVVLIFSWVKMTKSFLE